MPKQLMFSITISVKQFVSQFRDFEAGYVYKIGDVKMISAFCVQLKGNGFLFRSVSISKYFQSFGFPPFTPG